MWIQHWSQSFSHLSFNMSFKLPKQKKTKVILVSNLLQEDVMTSSNIVHLHFTNAV